MPTIMTRQSSSIVTTTKTKVSLKEQNAKLQKLTRNNDELRKQLIDINKKLSEQLEKKKIPNLMMNHNK